MKRNIHTLLRKVSGLLQSSTGSFKRHNSQYEEAGKLEAERALGLKNLEDDMINNPEMKVRDLLALHPGIATGVDIGTGTGWSAAALSPLLEAVIAIEPSEAALAIAEQIYTQNDYPNISWKQGFAEAELLQLKLIKPTLFLTGCVLSHIRDKEVIAICNAISKAAPSGSVLAFAECWGDESWHQLMWHVRTKDWWQTQLPDWELTFHGPAIADTNYHKGFWGTKK